MLTCKLWKNGLITILIFSLILSILTITFPSNETVLAQDDPASEIERLATEVHIQNLRTANTTRWIGGDLGRLDGTQIGARAGTQFNDWIFADQYDESQTVTVDDLTRPVLMNVWASWCGPCRFEFPFLTDYALNHDTSYDLWFLNANDTRAAAQRFLRSQEEGVITYVDTGDDFIRDIGLRVFPTTILVDTDGTILIAHSGVVTRTVMDFFDAVAANPYVGSLDTDIVEIPDLSAILGEINPEAATPIVFGQQVAGEINDETWRQDYRFEGEADQDVVITLTATGEDLDTYLVVIGPDGARVAENDDSESGSTDSSITLTLPETGTYVVIATRFLEADGFGSGGFNLQLNTAEQASQGNANAIQYGIPLSGRLTFELKQQNYLLDATAGDTVTFTLTHDMPDENLNLQVRLGAGERLVPYTSTENGELSFEVVVETTASYSVYVSRPQSSRAGPITYTLLVESDSVETPDTDTDASPESNEVVLNYGDSLSGAIDDERFERTYMFDGNSGDIVTIDLSADSGNLDTFLSLLAPDGSELATNDDADLTTTNSSIAEFILPESGTYTVIVSRFQGETGFTSGDYTVTLTLDAATNIDDTTDDNDAPTTDGDSLAYDSEVSGTITNEIFENSYTFGGREGDVITIEMSATDGNLDTFVTLLDPNGSELANNDDADLTSTNSSIAEFTLPESGIYTVVASRYLAASGTTTGEFSLIITLVSAGDGDDTDTTDNDNTPVSEGLVTIYSGSIDNTTFEETFTFEANVGDSVTIELTATDGNLDAYVTLLAPDGSVVSENDDADLTTTDSRLENIQLNEAGTYTVVASRYEGESGLSSGEFLLTVTLHESDGSTPPPTTDTPTETGNSLTYDSSVTGSISNDEFEIEYTFEGRASDVVSIQLRATSGDLDTYLVLLDPNGRILEINDDISASLGDFNSAIDGIRLPTDGIYMIVAGRFNGVDGTSTGNFELTLTSGNLPTDATTSEADGVIVYGQTISGTIDDNQPEFFYTFEGNEGDVVTIELTATSGDLDTVLGLFSPNDELLDSNDDIDLFGDNFNSALENVRLPETGTYVIVATRFEGADGFTRGDFNLTLSVETGGTPDDTDTTDTPLVTTDSDSLTYGDTASSSLDSTTFAESYTFDGHEGDVITVEMTAASGNLDTLIVLLSPDGEELIANDDIDFSTTNSQIVEFTLPETGTYTILATRYELENGLTSGDYILTLTGIPNTIVNNNTDTGGEVSGNPPQNTPNGNASRLNYGDASVGEINSQNLEDRFVFEGSAGDVVTITMSASSGDLDAYISLLNADGVEIAFNDNNIKSPDQNAAIIGFKLPNDGTYTIVATRYGVYYGHTSGGYELTLTSE